MFPNHVFGSHREPERDTPVRNHTSQSDRVVVPAKRANKPGPAPGAESVEGRTLPKGNPREHSTVRTQSRAAVSPMLERIRQIARRDKETRFNNVFRFIADLTVLRLAFYELKPRAAAGVDGVNWSAYLEDLDANIADLSLRLQTNRYQASPVRRVHIPKPDGRTRPLGVPTLEDKIVQRAFTMVVGEIFEQDFLGFSYGFRPGRGAHSALDAVYTGILTKKVNHVMDADIRSYFDTIPHGLLMASLRRRLSDSRALRLVMKWLKAGVLEKGCFQESEMGSPQGGIVSPLLANIYLHDVFDVWIHAWRKTEAQGNVIAVRYADDFVIGFQYVQDAIRCHALLRKRFEEYGLVLHPEKTRVIEFGPFAQKVAAVRGGKASTFDFLGFTHCCACKRSNGMFTIHRRTMRKRRRAKLKEVQAELALRIQQPLAKQGKYLRSVLSGYDRYYGVPGNLPGLFAFHFEVTGRWYRALRRRGNRRLLTWARMSQYRAMFLPKPSLHHPYPLERMGVTTQGRSRMR